MGEYIFELEEDVLNVHYHNIPLKGTNCPEFREKWKGTLSLPLSEFVEDVLTLSQKYIDEIAPIEAEVLSESFEGEVDMDDKLTLLKRLMNKVESGWRRS
ncbi:hypothetical protein [Thermococcus sp. MV11]|uniref:hypothetical protein n=1 Tax=Thermococcus sp. MV11 TaxID=1638267 RepID=UPI001430808C|nr:hypothetical protein [Thermococcus sp. MV11]NJE04134.1 hypothetical protein [Thermococcus sp. MV11]